MKRHVGGSWVLAPYAVWFHWSKGSWQSPCRCFDQYSATGALAHTSVNIGDSVTPGQEQLETYESSLPECFYNSIKQQTITLSDTKKAVKVGDTAVIDQEAIYARVIGLIVSQWELDLTDVLRCELAAYPPSMFNPDGSMSIATNKVCLKNSLAVETSVWVWGQPSVIIVDVLWTLPWPP